ncbi:1-acyl-sn-glycerol-3-phosphate acyltransferase [Streptomyces sp. NBC_01275]|uniref:lysophospholipid acyltransferase family protein n=1 Tax=Streptomyces sp. NBC_01275 TaxID=2903807 RepID=UPI0022559998|nr:lysophospholipid acyltransferase family protein [Streptomyces sp. NBC_01275]MCX4763937.1 1-acyl-sn-glycerol-3-phosphate acyltransferase [Streptomyces sp. NBC_01275]
MLRMLLRRLLLIPVRLILRPRVTGLENLPDGPFIIASNHLSFFDSFFIPLLTPRQVYFIGKQAWLDIPGVKGRLQAAFFRSVDMISVEKGNGAGMLAGLNTALDVLHGGDVVGIHVEGGRSPDRRLYKGTSGIAWLALASGVPVVPCGLIGTERVHPPGSKMLRVARFDVRFGTPLTFAEHLGQESDRRLRRSVTDRIVREIGALSGQEYAGIYLTTMRERSARTS